MVTIGISYLKLVFRGYNWYSVVTTGIPWLQQAFRGYNWIF